MLTAVLCSRPVPVQCFVGIKESGLKPIGISYGCLMMVCARQNDVDLAFQVYGEAYTADVEGDECHNILVRICSAAGRSAHQTIYSNYAGSFSLFSLYSYYFFFPLLLLFSFCFFILLIVFPPLFLLIFVSRLDHTKS